MIGVAFALRETFGMSSGIEGAAFVRVLNKFAKLRGIEIGTATLDEKAAGDAVEIASSTGLRTAFSTALSPYLLHAAEGIELEARFRMEAARIAIERFRPFDDVGPTLRELANLNVPSVALSGGWPSVDARKADIVGFADPIIFAEDLAIEASAPTAFARVAEMLRLPADRIWFVGTDVRREIVPAAATGMRTIWLNRGGESFPAHRTPPDATVPSFAGVLGVLSEPYTRGLLALRYILRSALDWRPGHVISAGEGGLHDDRSPRDES